MTEGPSQRILENLSTAVVVVDGGLRLRSINPAGELLFQLSARQILGQSLADMLTDNTDLIQALRQAHASQHPFTEHGVRLQLAGGRELTVDCSVTPLSRGGQADELLIELTRIDKLLRLAREESMQDQQDTSRAVIRGLAHEIKNPLGGLRGAAQLLERELPDNSLQEYTRIIIREADRLRNLVDRMVGPNTPLNKSKPKGSGGDRDRRTARELWSGACSRHICGRGQGVLRKQLAAAHCLVAAALLLLAVSRCSRKRWKRLELPGSPRWPNSRGHGSEPAEFQNAR